MGRGVKVEDPDDPEGRGLAHPATGAEYVPPPERPPDESPNGQPQPRLRLTTASSVKIVRPSWVWTDRIPVGGVTLVAGIEGAGKTAFVAHQMARMTRGQLPGDRHGRPGHVVYIGHEDDRASVLVPRLVAAGADLDYFHFVDLQGEAPFAVAADTGALDATLQGVDVAAVILDPLDSHLGDGIDSHKKAEVQRAIGLLAQLAQKHQCGAVGIAHLNKGESRDLLRKVVGSVGFTTSVRSMLGIGEHPDDPAQLVCVLRKANMTDRRQVPALRFRIEGTDVPDPDGGTINTANVVLLGEEAGLDANSILSVPDDDERGEREEAAAWLEDYLVSQGGRAPSADVKREAHKAGHRERTLKRALHKVATVETSGFPRRSTWVLRDGRAAPSQATPVPSEGGPTEGGGPTGKTLGFSEAAEGQSGQSGHGPETGPTVEAAPDEHVCRAVANRLVAERGVDPGDARKLAVDHYRRARRFSDPNSLFWKIAKKIDRGDLDVSTAPEPGKDVPL